MKSNIYTYIFRMALCLSMVLCSAESALGYTVHYVGGEKCNIWNGTDYNVSEANDYTIKSLSSIGQLKTWEYPNSTFIGWSIVSNDSPVDFEAGDVVNYAVLEAKATEKGVTISGNTVNLYAVCYTPTIYTVRYNTNGHGTIWYYVPPTVAEGSTFTLLSSLDRTAEGYEFVGWSTNASASPAEALSGTISIDLISGAADANNEITLYAIYRSTLGSNTITLHTNTTYGTIDNGQASQEITVDVGSSTSLPNPTVVNSGSYRFKGWSTAEGDPDGIVASPYEPSVDIDLYAIYAHDVLYKVVNPLNGNVSDVETVEAYVGHDITLREAPSDEFAHYTFSGWVTNAANPSPLYAAGSSYSAPNAPITFYAIYSEDPIYTVDFHTNTTAGTITNTGNSNGGGDYHGESYIGEGIALPTLSVHSGYRFLYWKERGSDNTYTSTIVKDTEGSYDMDAVYSALVTFDANGHGTNAPASIEPVLGATLTLTDYRVTQNAGFRFVGWALTSDATEALPASYTVTGPVTLYAVYIENERYTVIFHTETSKGVITDAGNEGGATLSKEAYLGDIISLPELNVLSGYEYRHWAERESAKTYTGALTKEATGTYHLDAVYRHYYMVTLAGGAHGSVSGTLRAYDDAAFSAPAFEGSAETGYRFAGWTDGVNTYQAGDAISITGNITLTALYEEHTFSDGFVHQKGIMRTSYTQKYGNLLQDVHELKKVIYATEGSDLHLGLSDHETYHMYVRWYDYRTDLKPSGLTLENESSLYPTDYGYFYINQGVDERSAIYHYTGGNPIIAAEQSDYTDYVFSREADLSGISMVNPLSSLQESDFTDGKLTVLIVGEDNEGSFFFSSYWGLNNVECYHESASLDANNRLNIQSFFAIENAKQNAHLYTLEYVSEGVYKLYNDGHEVNGNTWGDQGDKVGHQHDEEAKQLNLIFNGAEVQIKSQCMNNCYLGLANDGTKTYPRFNQADADVRWKIYALPELTWSTNITEPTLSQRLVYDIRPASTMADSLVLCTGDRWLETHNMLAPTGNTLYIGPNYDFYAGDYANYYVRNGENIVRLSGEGVVWQWKAGNGGATTLTDATVNNNRFVSAISNAATTISYELTATYAGVTYNVAKINVEYQLKSEIGPTESLAELKSSQATMLNEKRFNFIGSNKADYTDDRFAQEATYYWTPLSSSESTYGFKMTGNENVTTMTFQYDPHDKYQLPYYDEYAFVTSAASVGTWRGENQELENHQLAADAVQPTGYAIYVDGSTTPGEVMNLKFEANLCVGSTMYFSAFVADVSGDSYEGHEACAPNLDFVLTGITYSHGESKETPLVTYTTGEIGRYGGHADETYKWLHILFPFNIVSEVSYDSYTLKITNKGKNETGNDFLIDDIQIFVENPPVRSIQASTKQCIDDASGHGDVVAYARVDYGQFDMEVGQTKTIYYKWYLSDGSTPLPMGSYLYYNSSSYNGEANFCGRVTVKQAPNESEKYEHVFNFDEAYSETTIPVVGYIWEEEDETEQYFVYIAQPLPVEANKRYVCRVAEDPQELVKASSDCSSIASLLIAGGVRLSLDGTAMEGDQVGICGNISHTVHTYMKYVLPNDSIKELVEVEFECSADWLQGNENYVTENPSLYNNYTYAEIEGAIRRYQADQTSASKDTIDWLVSRNRMVLDTIGISIKPTMANKDSLVYTIFPREGRFAYKDHILAVCQSPRTATFTYISEINNMIMVGAQKPKKLPYEVTKEPRIVRVDHLQANSGKVTFPFNIVDEDDSQRDFYFQYAIIVSSTYPDYRKIIDDMDGDTIIELSKKHIEWNENLVSDGGYEYMTVSGNLIKALPHGYDYTLYFIPELEADVYDCTVGKTLITLRLVPETVYWKASSVTGAWNDDANWDPFVPLSPTNVVLLNQQYDLLDSIANWHVAGIDSMQILSLEPNAQPCISYDILYKPFVCNNIYVPAGAAFADQAFVNIQGNVYYDLKPTNGQFVMCAVPVQGIVAGDLFTPVTEMAGLADPNNVTRAEDHPFEVTAINQIPGEVAYDRIYNKYIDKYFNKTISQIGEEGSSSARLGWSVENNDALTPILPGKGVCIGAVYDEEHGQVIRLPKPDNAYYYYRREDSLWTEDFFQGAVVRHGTAGKAAYSQEMNTYTLGDESNDYSEEGNRVFVFGNPTLGYLDMNKVVLGNSDVLQYATYEYVENQNIASIEADGLTISASASDANRLLAPGRSAFVVLKSTAPNRTITITPEMIVDASGNNRKTALQAETSPARAPQRADNETFLPSAIYITARVGKEGDANTHYSHAMIRENIAASDKVAENEDVESLLLDEELTPFAIYTVADGKGLSINQFSQTTNIPLAFYAQTSTPNEVVKFTGNDAYLREWDLVNTKTNKRTQLYNGLSTTLSLPQKGKIQYMLEHARTTGWQDIEHSESIIHVYGEQGQLLVYCDEEMGPVTVYDANGRMLTMLKNAGRTACFELPTGLYIVRTGKGTAKAIVE